MSAQWHDVTLARQCCNLPRTIHYRVSVGNGDQTETCFEGLPLTYLLVFCLLVFVFFL